MAKKAGNTIEFTLKPVIEGYASVGGKKENEGPLGSLFDYTDTDDTFSQNTWEKAESAMQKKACDLVLEKLKIEPATIDFMFAGDLLNQCIGSNYGLRDLNIKFFGLYGACSTMAEGLILSAIMIESQLASRTISLTSSHFCSAERQFRFPLEYGSQRPPSAQWTVTGSGAIVLGSTGTGIRISRATTGRIVDLGVKDINNMGAAMAPAAVQTFTDFFRDTATLPDDYDLIVTGDLGLIGSEMVKQLIPENGFTLGDNYTDCGLMIYDRKSQDVHAGGSGCGCSASVLTSFILPKMERKEYKKVLFCGTGALMNQVSTQQGETIPSIAHLIEFETE